MDKKAIRNIGILSHVDAGKTTITENFLYLSGTTRQLGSVDSGSTITDSMELEQKRGISIRASAVSFKWKDTTINLLDTPGHVDFTAEVERVLRVLEGAIIVISAVEGVQAHTISLVDILKDFKIPFLIFINKIDREGADVEKVLNEIEKDLSILPMPIYLPIDRDTSMISSFWNEEFDFSIYEHIKEIIIENDDILMSKYIEGQPISKAELWNSAKIGISNKTFTPILSGAAKNSLGIEELLDSILEYLPESSQEKTDDHSVLIYKIEIHPKYGKLAHVKVFSGSINSKDIILNNRSGKEVKIGILRKLELNKFVDISNISSGNIGVISGIEDIRAGDILGKDINIPPSKSILKPVMTTVVKPVNSHQFNSLKEALLILNDEDPVLDLKWYTTELEFHLKIIGPIQIEVLENQIKERFGLDVIFENPNVIYKERPLKKAEGFVRYWMPKPCWAIMTFMIEPGEIGSGIEFKSSIRQSDIHQKYQNEVKRTIPKVLAQGIKGWEVTDIKITLVSGEDHNIHSRPGDFELATYMGIMRALENGGTELLEPILKFTIVAPEEHLGKIASDLTKMRAQFANPEFNNGYFSLSGTVPATTSMDYSIRISSLTSGKGRIRTKFKGYDICPPNTGVVRKYKGVSPLDEAQWILHRRGAYKAEER